MRTKSGLVEVSTISATEHFQSAATHTILGVPVGHTVAQIRVPAVYRYHVELAPEWTVRLRDKTFIVVAPPVEPSLSVAINTAGLQSQSFGIWSPITGQAVTGVLQRSITPALATKSILPAYIALQREPARESVAGFVQKWMVTQDRWKAAPGYKVRVFFSDEPIQALEDLPLPPLSRRIKPLGGLPPRCGAYVTSLMPELLAWARLLLPIQTAVQ
jgi:hypothetical protein